MPGSEVTNVLSAVGALIGYIGSEIATENLFERLLWPQRFTNGFSVRNALAVAILMPTGGPLHKAALQTLDQLFKYNLFKGDGVGHMLGTVFFRDTELGYTACGSDDVVKEKVRNGLWVRALAQIPMPAVQLQKKAQWEDGVMPKRPVRQRISVAHLTLSYANLTDQPLNSRTLIRSDTGPVTFKTLVALLVSETSGIAVSIAVAVAWNSYFMLLWLVPLLLKLLSTVFAIPREGLVIPEKINSMDPKGLGRENLPTKAYMIHYPGYGFQVIEGEESLVLQFFRHYGHPVRRRSREVLQIFILFAFGFIFPVGLLLSIIWMPTKLQYTWLFYQLYATLAMHFYRYMGGHELATTEEMIAMAFVKAEKKRDGKFRLLLDDGKDIGVAASLSTTYHDSFAEGRDHARELLCRKTSKLGIQSEPSTLSSLETPAISTVPSTK